jgi:hypothetical protein
MGQQLLDYYKQAEQKAGIQGKVKLAMLTKISSQDAASAPDSPENIQTFKDALSKL